MFIFCFVDIEAQIADIQSKKKELTAAQAAEKGVGLLESGYFDSELYDDGSEKRNRYEGYMTSIATNDMDEDDDDDGLPIEQKRTTYTAPKSVLKDVIQQVCSQCITYSLIQSFSMFIIHDSMVAFQFSE